MRINKLFAAALLAAMSVPALAADVGVSVSVNQPGLYGRIDIGNVPQPQVIYAEPVIIRPIPRGVVYQPVYVHVPPGHEKKWRKHCHKYNACGRPVYFVRDTWYNDVYVPARKKRGDHDDDHGHDHGKHDGGGKHGDGGKHGNGGKHGGGGKHGKHGKGD